MRFLRYRELVTAKRANAWFATAAVQVSILTF
jgi:hypothetical protein